MQPLSAGFRRQVSLGEYCGIKYRGRPRDFHRGNNDLGCKAGKMEIPTFDGAAKSSAKAWVQKLDAYRMTTLGHAHITSYADFTQRLIDRFDQGDPKLHFRELTQLKKTGTTEAFIEEFQRLAVMVPDVSESRLMMLFFEGMTEPLCGWVKDFKPNTFRMRFGRLGTWRGQLQKTNSFQGHQLLQGERIKGL
jgi:hypothetical protein